MVILKQQNKSKGRQKTMNIFYARVSTEEQNEARQIQLAKENGIDERYIFIDKQSGKDTNRKEYQRMMNFVREGDCLIVESISRIARNTADLLNIVAELQKKGVEFVSKKENIDTNTPQGKFMLTVFGAMAELEREQILQRQREGIAIAKAEGKYKGKPKMAIDDSALVAECKKWRAGEQTATETMKKLNLKPNTFYRRVKEKGL
jgi:DNA invertase Pin-like site-specific DNA recombinase